MMKHRIATIDAHFDDSPGRPRLLIEDPDAWAYADHFTSLGYNVATCSGPQLEGPDCSRCSLVWEGSCSAVDSADVILTSLPLDVALPIVQAIGERAGSVATVLHVPEQHAARYEQLLGEVTIVPFPASLPELETAVRQAAEPAGATA